MTLVVLGSVAAVAIPLAALLEWWSVRALLTLVGEHARDRDRNCRGSALARPALSAARN
jgi:hypothetical protein